MTFIISFLLILFLYKLGKILWRGWTFSRQWRRATENMREAYRRAAEGANRSPEQPTPKKKKIDPTVGEYIAFEEVKTETSTFEATSDGNSSSIRAESQVEDAVWEEIK